MPRRLIASVWLLLSAMPAAAAEFPSPAVTAPTPPVTPDRVGYYRYPAVHGRTVVFTAEGDLWRVPLEGGVAQRLTSHVGEESRAAISPDGKWVAFTAAYDGPNEAYVMPLDGGLPKRLTWDGLRANVLGWTPEGEVMIATRRHSGLPAARLAVLNPATGERRVLPLAQAAEGAWLGRSLVFTRQEPNFSATRRYRGGLAQQLWIWDGGSTEARRLMPSDSAVSRQPMAWNGRVWFVGDRDLDMNLWSVAPDGSDARQHTFHRGWDVMSASLSEGRVVYQRGADLRVFDIGTGTDAAIPIRLASDFDQMRERWVSNPVEWVSAAHLSPTGDRVVLTARGQVFVAPAKTGRLVQVTRDPATRWRQARFLPDGRTIVGLSDASGEIEWWKAPANGVGEPSALSRDGRVIRWDGAPSPDGRWLASWNRDRELWLLEIATGRHRRIATFEEWNDFQDVSWSPDSRWLLYVRPAPNLLLQVVLYDTQTDRHTAITSERWDSYSPKFSPDGKWIWFLSDRHYQSVVPQIWGSRQPDPFFDRTTKVYALSLRREFRSPFAPADELHAGTDEVAKPAPKSAAPAKGAKAMPSGVAPVTIELDGIAERLIEAPVPPGNYSALSTDGKRLWWLSTPAAADPRRALQSVAIEPEPDAPGSLLDGVESYELSADGKKLLVRKGTAFHVFDAGGKAPDKLDETRVRLDGWRFTLDPRIEWRQMFAEAWRLHRDYFWDPAMGGVDWTAVREKFRPLAERVTTRAELSDVLAQMVGDLSVLHTYVRGGDDRRPGDPVDPASLGAVLERDERAGGFRVVRVLRGDPDRPDRLGPLAKPEVGVRDGDVITAINGVAARSAPDVGALLRGQSGRSVLLRVQRPGGEPRDVLVEPVAPARETDLRYSEWELGRRLRVDSLAAGRIGYVHLRAMGPDDIAQWQRDYFPVWEREGLVVDLRGNRGGNIDSWILGKLLRRAWAWWQPRSGRPFANMPFAFRGKLAVIVDESTISDGELFADGVRRLGLGRIVGTRTWGGEIWLSADNFLVDRGIATAAETGVYGPEGEWLIEGRGLEPDVVVDNLPLATAAGADAQLDAAVRLLLDEIARSPRRDPVAPPRPDRSDPRR